MIYIADYVVTQNATRDCIYNGAVAVEGNRIADVGFADEVISRRRDDERLNLGQAVIMPGLINGHTHIAMSALRGYSDDKTLMDWLQKDIFPAEARLTFEIIKISSLFSCTELIRTGCTSFYDMYMMADAVAEAADESGLRAVLGESVSMFFPGLAGKDEETLFERVREYSAKWKNKSRINGAVCPHSVYTTDAGLLERCRELADETGFLFSMHMSETKGETQNCLKETGMRPLDYCRSLGILRSDTTLYHMVDVDDDDLRIVKECGCAIVHNPASNMKLASGVAPISKMLDFKIPVAIGTDGPASNNSQNMVREMYLASLLQKVDKLDPLQAPAHSILDMATAGGSAALHNKNIGSLEKGKLADFIALDLTSPNMQPVHSIISNIVYSATGLENRLTVVDGQILYKDGEFLTLDYDGLSKQIHAIRDWVYK